MTHPDRRRAGRAIRKMRRESAKLTVAWAGFGEAAQASAKRIRVFMATLDHFADVTRPTMAEVNSMIRVG